MDNFIHRFNYLGATLGLSPKIKNYVDLECFFLEATLYFEDDARVKQGILNWSARYAILLSPSKIRRLLKQIKYNENHLHTLVCFLIKNHYVGPNWNILLTRKGKSKILFQENFKKYLKDTDFIIKNVIEIRYRAEGRNQIISDILSFTQKSHFSSLYQLAKSIHSPRNRVNELVSRLRSFGIIQ